MAATPRDPDAGVPMNVRVTNRDGGVFDAAIAIPADPNGRAVVVLQEIFGVTRKIRGYCEMFAQLGYIAIAPDLFWRMDRGVQLSHDAGDIQRAFGYLKRFDEVAGLVDIDGCVAHLREQGMAKVAVVGFCLGGKLAALIAARGEADAGVAFYGVGLEQSLDALRDLSRPLQLHFGNDDAYAPPAAVASIEAALAGAANVELYRYEGAGHAFFRPDLKDAASPVAWDRTVAFLRRHLSPEDTA